MASENDLGKTGRSGSGNAGVGVGVSGGGGKPKRPLWPRLLFLGAGGLLGIGALGVALAPTIAGSYGPGMIEDAAEKSIKGSVKVGKLSVGWFSSTAVGPVEIRDDKGKLAATLDVSMPASLWQVVSERWWSASRLDVGTITLAGMVELERDETGKTNLEKAIEPKQPAPARVEKPAQAGGLEALKASLNITRLDIKIREKAANGTFGPDMGIKDLKGTAAIEFGGPSVKLVADLSGNPIGVAATEAMKVKVDATASSKGTSFEFGKLEKSSVKAEVVRAPVPVIDALAGLAGGLVSAMGETAEITVDASGNMNTGSAKVNIASTGVEGRFDVALAGGVITAQGGPGANTLKVRSTEFFEKLPQTREMVANIRKQAKLTSAAPGVELRIDQLRFPMPGGGVDAASVDARGSGLSIVARVSGMQGRVDTGAASGGGTSGAAAGDWKSFAVEPMTLTIAASDLSQPITVSGGASATIDGQPAGSVELKAVASGLLDSGGRMRVLMKGAGGGTLAERVVAEIKIAGMSAALVQPMVAGTGLALDLRQDVGPTLDGEVTADVDVSKYQMGGVGKAGGGAAEVALPPMDVNVNIRSANIRAAGRVRVENNVLTTGAEGVSVSVSSAGPLLSRMLSSQASPAATVSGVGEVGVTVRDVQVGLDKLKGDQALGSIKAKLEAKVRDLSVRPTGAPAGMQPLEVLDTLIRIALVPGAAPQIEQTASFRQQGQAFGMQSQVSLEGMKAGKLPAGQGLDMFFRSQASGTVKLDNVPRGVLALVPGLGVMLDDAAQDNVALMMKGAIGRSASVDVTFAPVPSAEGGGSSARVKLSTEAQGVGGDFAGQVTSKSATLSGARLFFSADPNTLNPALAASGGGNGPAMRIAQAFRIDASVLEPIVVPMLKDASGALLPDFAKAGDVNVAIKSDSEIVLDNVKVGTDASGQATTTQLRIRNLDASARAPVAALMSRDKSQTGKATLPGTTKFSAQVLKGDGSKIADISGHGSGGLDGSNLTADVRLASIDVAAADALLGQQGKLSGALGATAEADVKITPLASGGEDWQVVANIKAPRVSGGTLNLLKQGQTLVLQQPTTITWSPDVAFMNSVVLKADQPGSSLRLTQISPLVVELRRLAVAIPNVDVTKPPVQGLMKQGVFGLDVSVSVAQAAGSVNGGGSAGGAVRTAGESTAISMSGLRVSAKNDQQVAGAVDAEVTIDAITAPGGTANRAVVKGRASNLADSIGNVQAGQAVYDLDANLPGFPTAILDQLGKQKGVLMEALGPTVNVTAKAQNVTVASGTAQSGRIEAKATSQRANADIIGDIRNGAFVQSGATGAQIIEIRPQLVPALAGSIPLVETIEKTQADGPAVIQGQNMQVPIDGDVRKLNGTVTINPGIARFTTKSVLGDLIELAGGKAQGSIGNRLEPFVVKIVNGVATYERFKLPIGQFNIETTGVVDLVNRQINVVTYVPLFSLTAKAAGGLNTGIAGKLGILDKNTQVPITTKGSLDNPTTQIDVGLFAQETADRLLKEPQKLLEKGLDDALKNLFDKPKPPATTPPPAPAPAPAIAPAKPAKPKKP